MAHTVAAQKRGGLFFFGQNARSRTRSMDAVRAADAARALGGAGTGGVGGADELNPNAGALVLPSLGKASKKIDRPGPYMEWAVEQERLDKFQKEVQALVDFFRSTHGSNWHRRDNWCNPDVHVREWYGVKVEGSHVRELELASNNIGGVLPSSLRQLRRLERLVLTDNKIGGKLPSLKGMTRLVEVNICYNRITGCEKRLDAPPNRSRLPRLMHFLAHHNAFAFSPPPGAEQLSLLQERTQTTTGKPGSRNWVPERTSVRYQTADHIWVTCDVEKNPPRKLARGKVIVKDPDEIEAQRLIRRAQRSYNDGQMAAAVADFDRVIALKPSKALPYHGKAACIFALVDFQQPEALEMYDRCVRLVHKSLELDRWERRGPTAATAMVVDPQDNLNLLRRMMRELEKGYTTEQKRACVVFQKLQRGNACRRRLRAQGIKCIGKLKRTKAQLIARRNVSMKATQNVLSMQQGPRQR